MTSAPTLLLDQTVEYSSLQTFASLVRTELQKSEPFCLWLEGDLGAGKTTFVGACLRALGLNPNIPVTSPTYTYMNEYTIHDLHYAHLDLYRADGTIDIDDMGFLEEQTYHGMFIEWPTAMELKSSLQATHMLKLCYNQSDTNTRHFQLFQL